MANRPEIQDIGISVPYLRGFIIAPPGWGKTVFCGTAPRSIYLTTDPEGTASAAAMGSTAKEVVIRDWDTFNNAYIWLREEGYKEFDFVILDNISELQRMAKLKSMEISKKFSNNPTALDEYIPQQNDHQRSQAMILQASIQMFDLPMHVIMTSHIKGMEDGEGEPFYSAGIHGLQGQLANQILGYANVIGMGESRQPADDTTKIVRRLWFSHWGPYRGKDRFVALGRYKDDIDVPTMVALIEAAKAKRLAAKAKAKPKATRASTAPKTAPAKAAAGTTPATTATTKATAAGRRRVARPAV